MSFISKNQLSKLNSTSFFGIKLWVIIICLIAISTIFILIIIICLYICFRRRSKNKPSSIPYDNNHIYGRNYSTSSSINKRLLSCNNGSNRHINMVPIECGVIRPMEVFSSRQFYTKCHWFSMDEIIEATNSFNNRNFIGIGPYGKVYGGVLNGIRVAIKELTFTSLKAEQFRLIVEAIPNMTHKNLVKMIGFCVEQSDFYTTRYMLISEYVDHGNLHQWLHENDVGDVSPLTWRTRMHIISGIAKGLAYMHEDVPKVVHTRLHSRNILLDHQWNPKISDFLVARLLSPMCELSDDVAYITSKLEKTFDMNEKDDVYNFGMLLIEIITGKKPIDHNKPKDEHQIVTWLKSKILNQNYERILDPNIPQVPPLKELKRVLLIALRCVDLGVENRPKMGEVIHMLEPRDLLLSNGQEVYGQSSSDDHSSDDSLGDESKHVTNNREVAITIM